MIPILFTEKCTASKKKNERLLVLLETTDCLSDGNLFWDKSQNPLYACSSSGSICFCIADAAAAAAVATETDGTRLQARRRLLRTYCWRFKYVRVGTEPDAVERCTICQDRSLKLSVLRNTQPMQVGCYSNAGHVVMRVARNIAAQTARLTST